MEQKNYFTELFTINLNDKAKKKQNLTYVSWAWAWAEIKKHHPDATYTIYHRTIRTTVEQTEHYPAVSADPEKGIFADSPATDVKTIKVVDNEVNYFSDGRTYWVKVGVTVNGIEHIEELPIMNLKNQAETNVTSISVNKAIQRALTKACARHGVGLYVYAGEDLPEDLPTNDIADSAEKNFISLKSEVVDRLQKAMGTKHEEAINGFIRSIFTAPVSQSTMADYDKLVEAKQFLDNLDK